jgi:hypothetical protein
MANVITTQILEDGQENTIMRVVLLVNTSDIAATPLIDPATLSDIGPFAGRKATQLRVKKVIFDIEDTLDVNFYWDATTPLIFEELVGRGINDYRDAGGLQNNAGAGKTGKILIETQGWATGAILQATLTIYMGKQV